MVEEEEEGEEGNVGEGEGREIKKMLDEEGEGEIKRVMEKENLGGVGGGEGDKESGEERKC